MARRRLADFGCKAGGASYGYWLAGWEPVGIDKDPQPNYPFEFHQGDMLTYPLDGFDAYHASPPCQTWTAYRRRGGGVGEGYQDLIEPMRERLAATGKPYVLENLPRSPVRNWVQLCGSSFGLDVQRHRGFEIGHSPWFMSPPCQHGIWTPRFPCATNRTNLRRTVEVGVWRIPLPVQQAAMGINWMALDELTEAIPPAYTEHIGRQLLDVLKRAA